MHLRHARSSSALRFLAIAVAALALAIGFSHRALGAPGGEGQAATVPEWRVGAFLSLSGEDADFGVFTRDGIELAVDEINKGGGPKGKPIKVLYEDDKSNSLEANNKVLQLIDRDKVVALLGEVTSARSKAGGIVANKKRIPMITPSSTNPDVTKVGPFIFRVCFTDDIQAQTAAAFIVDKLGKKRVGLLFATDDLYSAGLAEGMRQEVKKRGGEIIAEKGFLKKETNFTTYLNELVAAKPDIIYAPIFYNQMSLIARQGKAIGIKGEMFAGGDGWDGPELLTDAGDELEGAYFTNFYAPDVPWPSAQAFRVNYTQRFHRDPSSNAAMGYDATKLLADAIERSTDGSPEAIRKALQETKGFQGAFGAITMDAERNADKPVIVVRIKDKKFTYFSTVRPEVAAPGASNAAAADEALDLMALLRKIRGALETGLAQGAMIALVALGYTMVYGILKLINFAHSEVFMMGAYAGLFAITALGGESSPLVAGVVGTLAAMLLAGALGVTVERIAYAPLRGGGVGSAPMVFRFLGAIAGALPFGRLGVRFAHWLISPERGAGRGKSANSRITPLVTALGMSVLLQNVAQLLFTAQYRGYPRLLPIQHTRQIIFVTAVAVMVALQLLVHRTWTGKAMRALSMNMEAARLMGVRTSRIIALTFVTGSMLAAVGAVLYCLDQSQVYPTMGVTIGTRAFVAAVIGGIGNIPGAMLGGVLIGIIGELTKLTPYSGLQDVLVFTVLIGVLLVRPTGLMGKAGIEKV